MIHKLENFTDFVVENSKTNFGNCSNLFESYEFTTNLICNNIIDTLNGFWFCLGFCASLLPLNIIFGVKLAKFFRRMEIVDEYVDVIDNNYNKNYRRSTLSRYGNSTSYGHTTVTEEGTSYYSEATGT